MGTYILGYVNSEKYLRIMINKTINFIEQANALYIRANERLGFMKSTWHFVHDLIKRRMLYQQWLG